ncbi:T9SS type B sorting domain-containing protein [Chryseobacterium suipulveris]|uniref:T9SS type B sorting domain-containing protein n=1 Tax=Chryseobacterium suipulveris TaxID=2929800 RepID=A0ABY4BWV9_9FLAO|nr:T9SS type B sorting domain-containing protein [Chryseobacterium suipulveris]UOE42346.1 T9SS type B sorting domain-containing protein [Chryseobacterium suipulveris]
MPFAFDFYGKVYDKVVVGSNGRLIFGKGSDFENLHLASIDKTHSGNDDSSTNIKLASDEYHKLDPSDPNRILSFSQIFFGFTDLGYYNASDYNKLTYGNVNYNGKQGLLFNFDQIRERTVAGGYSTTVTSQVLLLNDNTYIVKIIKADSRGNAIIGIQNENGTKAQWPPNSEQTSPYNNGKWSNSSNAWLFTPNQTLTPQFKWFLNGAQIAGQSGNTYSGFTPINDGDKIKVEVTYLEDPTKIETGEVIFRKVQTPVIEGTLSCAYEMSVNAATFDPGMRYTWYRVGEATPVATGRTFSIHRSGGTVGDYYVKMTNQDGSAICPGFDESNRLRYEKQRFPGIIKTDYYFCDNSVSPAATKTINLYEEFYPKYNVSSGLEPYQIIFAANGTPLSDADAQNFQLPANQNVLILYQVKDGAGIYTCQNGPMHAYFLSMKAAETITVCASANTFDLKTYFEKPSYPTNYRYTYTYSDGTGAGNGSSVDVTKIVNIKTTIGGANCSTTTTVNFVHGSAMTLPDIPVQERCSGADTNANRFDFNHIKNLLDPSNQYDVEFYRKDNNQQILPGPSGSFANLNAAGYFWTNAQGDFVIYAKVINKTDPTCFAVSSDIVLRVYVRPTKSSGADAIMKRKACGSTAVNLEIQNVFDVVNNNNFEQIPVLKYYDAAGIQLTASEVSAYAISRGTPYVLVQNGACVPPLRIDFNLITAPIPLLNPLPETLCDDSDGSLDGKIKIKIASDNYKAKFTSSFSGATFKYYVGSTLIHTSTQSSDNFEFEISNNTKITVAVSHPDFCDNNSDITFIINTPNPVQISGNVNLCYDDYLLMNVTNAADYLQIEWFDAQGNFIVKADSLNVPYKDVKFETQYKVVATDIDGCISQITFTPSKKNQPVITAINQTDSSIEVIATGGSPPYKYYFNGVKQSSNILYNPTASSYIVQVATADGCLGEPKTVYLIKVNNAFTPNADGINDFWTIENLGRMQNITVKVADRYGNIVYEYGREMSITSTSPGSSGSNDPVWDGKFIGKALPTATYWYIVSWFDPVAQKNEQRQGWVFLKNRD